MTAVFVFGSNQAGRHGKGAALEAVRKWGAIYGQGWGRQGDSYAMSVRPPAGETFDPVAVTPDPPATV